MRRKRHEEGQEPEVVLTQEFQMWLDRVGNFDHEGTLRLTPMRKDG
mgnify:CR=1 FL=1